MAFWNATQIVTINDGTVPNDGTGDPVRDAFIKVNENFANISYFLGQPTPEFLNANVSNQIDTVYLNSTNSYLANVTGVNSDFSGNSTSANVLATDLYVAQQGYFSGNINIDGNIVPVESGIYNLGTPTRPFGNLYVQTTISTTQVSNSTTAGLFEIHANIGTSDVQDVGIFANVSNNYGSNTYAFFGHQFNSGNFVYKITPTDATKGNNVIYDGIYGGAQLGGLYLSNTTISTNTTTGALVVAGGVGIGGNLNLANSATIGGSITAVGNIYSGGYQVLTTNLPGISVYTGSQLISGNLNISSVTNSTSPSTGALIVNYGGVGVGGNINAGGNIASTSGIVGPLYGTIMTAAQPNITSVGTLSTLNVGSISATAVGVTNLTATGTVNFTGATISNLPALTVTGNITAGNVSAYQITGKLQGTIIQPSQPNITTLGNIINLQADNASTVFLQAINFSTANAQITGGAITGTPISGSTGSFTTLTASGNVAFSSTLFAQGIYDNSIRVVSTSTGNGNLTIVNGAINLTPIGPGIVTVGNTTTIPVITTDEYGRITTLATASISTTLNTAGNSGTSAVNLASQTLSIIGGTDISTTDSAQTITINNTSNLQSVTGRGATTSNPVTFTGQVDIGNNIIPTANAVYNLGSTAAWFNQFYGVATHAYYADLAERYVADSDYVPGTVVVFGGVEEITVTAQFADARVAGAISTDPAYLMNAMSPGLPVALRGKIPVQVIGPVNKGDSLVTAGNMPGYAVSVGTNTTYGQAVFAKSLTTDLSDGVKTIIAVIL